MVLLKVKLSWSFKGGFLKDMVGCWGEGEPGCNFFSRFTSFTKDLYLTNLFSKDRGAVWPFSFGSHFPMYITEHVGFQKRSLTVCWCSRWGKRRKRAAYLPIQPLSKPASWVRAGVAARREDRQCLREASTELHKLVREGGNLHPKAPLLSQTEGTRAALHGLELPSPAQSTPTSSASTRGHRHVFKRCYRHPPTEKPTEVSSVVCWSTASEGQAQDKQHCTIRCLAGWETSKTSLCSTVLSRAEWSTQRCHTLPALELCTSGGISPKALGCIFPLPTPLTILNVQHQLPPKFRLQHCDVRYFGTVWAKVTQGGATVSKLQEQVFCDF